MSLLERDSESISVWKGSLPVTSRYTYGLAGERFFRALKDETRIFGTHCSQCNHTYVPATLFCERCLHELNDWVDVGITGEIHTFTFLHVNYDGTPRESPEIVAFIRLGDGGLIHRISGTDFQDIKIGMKVKAIFKPKAERDGSILDIKYFQPIHVK